MKPAAAVTPEAPALFTVGKGDRNARDAVVGYDMVDVNAGRFSLIPQMHDGRSLMEATA